MFHIDLESAKEATCNHCMHEGVKTAARHKVAEVMDSPFTRHEFNVYLCCHHFGKVIPQAAKYCEGVGPVALSEITPHT